MEDLLRSMLRLPWELSRLGLRQLGAERPAWRELENKLDAFGRFRASAAAGPLPTRGAALAAALQPALAREPWDRLWSLEGLGQALGDSAWDEGSLAGLLCAPMAPEVLLPLHTGVGISLAGRAVEAAGRDGEVSEILPAFAGLCERTARPGCAAAVFEALGLAARTLRPERVPELDRMLLGMGEEPRSLFWHGVGRGLYFVPTNAMPASAPGERALDKALAEAPDEPARRQVLGGLVWALTLVNFRDPGVLEDFLKAFGPGPSQGEVFAHGVSMGATVWALSNGEDAVLERFLRHEPCPAVREVWSRVVSRPCKRALRETVPRVRQEGRCGALFLFRREAAA
ncbi:MAG TPA: hypothetical protein VN493_00650 [Thermoanaerobaculia bacterium]|nr:hypothetical protein [Thermoanaerobaculia bacterium]